MLLSVHAPTVADLDIGLLFGSIRGSSSGVIRFRAFGQLVRARVRACRLEGSISGFGLVASFRRLER